MAGYQDPNAVEDSDDYHCSELKQGDDVGFGPHGSGCYGVTLGRESWSCRLVLIVQSVFAFSAYKNQCLENLIH